MPRRIAQERVPTASNVGSRDVTWVIGGLPDLLQIDKFQVPLSQSSSSAAEARRGVAVFTSHLSLLTFHPLSRLFAGPIP